MWRHERFWFSPATGEWSRRHFDMKRSFQEIHRMACERVEEGLRGEGTALDRAFVRHLTYGDNTLDVSAKPFPVLVMHEALKPFFAFQVVMR